jgi:beta-glucosidase
MSSLAFPVDFRFGTATSAYQVEGAWNEAGKGLSIWDMFVRRKGAIADGSTGDVAADHYHRFRDDVALMRALGFRNYRFSISWPRVFPRGWGDVNPKGLDFYDALVETLRENGIEPFVTLYHWDMPDQLQREGGWYRRSSTDRFADFTETVVRRLGDRVTYWMPINEPFAIMAEGHALGTTAPGRKNLLKVHLVGHHLLLAHGKSLQRIKALRPSAQVGVVNALWPNDPFGPGDVKAAVSANDYFIGFFMDPIFRKRYPSSLERMVSFLARGIRLEDFEVIGQPVDFVGVNYYSRNVVRKSLNPIKRFAIVDARRRAVPVTAMGFEIYPEGMGRILRLLKEEYDDPVIYITESGAAFEDDVRDGKVDDDRRIDYLRRYLVEVHRALQEGVRVKGHFVWSFLDNFEWADGLSRRLGLVYVDYRTQQRIVKKSGRWYSELCRSGVLREEGTGEPRRDGHSGSA